MSHGSGIGRPPSRLSRHAESPRGIPRRIGVVSDTHNHLANAVRIVELFNAARVERVVHTGDITQAKTLHCFAGLDAPLVGVFGNNDLEREGLEAACARTGARFSDGPLRLEWGGRRICVIHDPTELPHPTDAPEGGPWEVLLHGHTHRLVVERSGGRLVFNPGECAGHLTGYNAVGVLDLETLDPELLRF